MAVFVEAANFKRREGDGEEGEQQEGPLRGDEDQREVVHSVKHNHSFAFKLAGML